jgi:hypothetical protein
MARTADVVHAYRTTNFAGVVDDDVAKTHEPLRNAGLDGYVLNFAQRDVFCGAGNQAGINLQLGIGNCVLNPVSPDVVIRGNQQQRERKRDRNPRRHSYPCEQKNQRYAAEDCQRVASFDEEHRGSDREDGLFQILIAVEFKRARLEASDSGRVRVAGRRTAVRTKTDAGSYVCSATGTCHLFNPRLMKQQLSDANDATQMHINTKRGGDRIRFRLEILFGFLLLTN